MIEAVKINNQIRNMTTIAHISDLHFGCEAPMVREGLLASLEHINPELVVISGDLTQQAKRREFQAAHAFLATLPYPYLIVPGNHDLVENNLPERLLFPWQKWRQYISRELEPVIHEEAYVAIGVNTARRVSLNPDWSRGSISRMQVARIRRQLQTTPTTHLRLLTAHHPFWLPPMFAHRELVKRGASALQAFQSEVDIILSGHVHLAYAQVTQGVIVSHAGTTLSNRLLLHHTNSFNVIRGDRQRLSVELMEWGSQRFRFARQQVFRREDAGWHQQH
ncbi:MAG: hypothetical protein RL122_1174 [Pseudomonadota bacterium]|jgi:3',5'-cyclic AMP phosphodiesterase CpdA|nr:metallophosphoesterase [Thiothrix fructosivorans]